MTEKINPFIWHKGRIDYNDIKNIKKYLIEKKSLNEIHDMFPQISIETISKIHTGMIYTDVAPEYNEALYETKRIYMSNNNYKFIKGIYDYYINNPGVSDNDVAIEFGISPSKAEDIRRLQKPFDSILKGEKPIIYSKGRFTQQEVENIRKRLNKESVLSLSKEFKCSRSLIQDIKYKRGAYKE